LKEKKIKKKKGGGGRAKGEYLHSGSLNKNGRLSKDGKKPEIERGGKKLPGSHPHKQRIAWMNAPQK